MADSRPVKKSDSGILDTERYLHGNQLKVFLDGHRFKVVVAGRRFGKTFLALMAMLRNAITYGGMLNWYIAPTYRQVKDIAWKLLFEIVPKEAIRKKNEVELTIELTNGSTISLKGADNPDSLRGVGLSFAVMDEYGEMKENVWSAVVRPMLMDAKAKGKGGEAMFIGTPKGFNHFYDIYNSEKTDDDFKSWHFTSYDNLALDPDEIHKEVEKLKKEASISELKQIEFSQEILAQFEVLTGIPYFSIGALKKQEKRKPISKWDIFDIYEEPSEVNYIIGSDVAEGLDKGDNTSVFVVNRKTLNVVAEYTGKLPPDVLAEKLILIGKYYNNAFIGVEVNNHGLTTLTLLRDRYDNLYYRTVYDEIADRWTKKLGWQTTNKTRPLMLDNLARLIREGDIELRSEQAIHECMTFTINDGKPEAQEGCFDDRVIALAICYKMIDEVNVKENEEIVKPKVERGSVAWYEMQDELEEKDWRSKYRRIKELIWR